MAFKVTQSAIDAVRKALEKAEMSTTNFVVTGKERDGDKRGKTTGLKMTHFVDAVLRTNESVQADDGVLQAALLAEFPNRGGKSARGVQAISAYRSYFNRSAHGHNPDGKGKSESHGRRGENAPEAVRAEKHPLAGRTIGTRKGSKKAARKGAGSKGKGSKKAARKPVAKKAPATA